MKTLEKIPGNRKPDNTSPHLYEPGDYSKNLDAHDNQWSWHGRTPSGVHCWLKNHKCIENEDGTLSVLPPSPGEEPNSILCSDPTENPKAWHGFIYNGVWREIG